MKNQRHKRKEFISILFISNTDRKNRQLRLSLTAFRAMGLVFFLLGAVFVWSLLTWRGNQSAVASLNQQLSVLEQETAAIQSENQTLTAENRQLQERAQQTAQTASADASPEEASSGNEPVVPKLYPSTGSGVLKSTYTEEQPYISISAYSGGTVVAAGDGTITAVSSDDTYSHIIEISHENGYKTRYLCHQQAEADIQEGTVVQAGDTLLTITTDDTQLDYQVIHEDEPVDPLSVIDARG